MSPRERARRKGTKEVSCIDKVISTKGSSSYLSERRLRRQPSPFTPNTDRRERWKAGKKEIEKNARSVDLTPTYSKLKSAKSNQSFLSFAGWQALLPGGVKQQFMVKIQLSHYSEAVVESEANSTGPSGG